MKMKLKGGNQPLTYSWKQQNGLELHLTNALGLRVSQRSWILELNFDIILQTDAILIDADFGMQALKDAKYLYSCDVRLLDLYPRNVEKRINCGKGSN